MHARDAYANAAYTYPPLYVLYALYVVRACPRYTARLKCYIDVVSGYGWIRRGHEYYNPTTMTIRNIPVRWFLVKLSPSNRTCKIWNFSFTKIEIRIMNLSVVYVTEILASHIRFLAEGMSHRSTRNKPLCTWKYIAKTELRKMRGTLSKS